MAVKGSSIFLQPSFATSSPEMAAYIAEKDWSQTPVGSPERWSPALRMMVAQVLGNGFGLLLWWGPQFVQFYNDAYRPILGSKHPKALGQPVSECWNEIWDVIGPMIEQPFRGGPPSVMDDLDLVLDRNGFSEEAHFTVAYSPVFDETVEGGIGGVLATVQEITEKVIGARRMRLLSDLGVRTAEAKTPQEACIIAADVLAGAPRDVPFASFYLCDRDTGRYQLVATTGTRERDALPDELDNADGLRFLVPGAFVIPMSATVPGEYAGLIVAGASPNLAVDDDYRKFFDLVAAPVATAITNARAYEEERRRADALAEIDRAKNVFFSNVSHEFRTPLTLMLGPLHELAKRADDESLPLVDAAQRNSLRLLKLVNTLLEFSRIEAGRTDATYVKTDLAALTADLCGVFRSAIESAGLTFEVDIHLEEPAFVDREMWEKIVLNLLSNALKFTLKGGVRVALGAANGEIELRVEDTGCGVPQEEIARVFERFRRVRNAEARSHEGSGIGLALTSDLVAMHGGTIELESTVGVGSTFCVRIPLGHEHLDPAHVLHEPPVLRGPTRIVDEYLADVHSTITHAAVAAPRATKDTSRANILVADDNADLRAYVSRILLPKYNVDVVANGVEALERAREQRYDLVVSDVMMPKMDGFELLASMRSDEDLSDVPLIFLSARAGEEAAIEGLARGADGYLVKPFSAEELIARVEALLRGVRRREDAGVDGALRRWFASPGKDFAHGAIFRSVVDRLPTVVYEHDATGAISYANEAWYETSGLPRESSSLTVEAWRRGVHPDDLPNMLAAIESAVASRSSYGVEFRLKRVDDGNAAYRWYLYRAIPRYDDGNEFQGWIGTGIDVHEAHVREETQRAIARSFQNAALPTALPSIPGVVFSALYEPASSHARVGGDFYDAFRIADGRLVLSVGDVAGSGLEAAATMAAVRQSIRAAANINPDPELLLRAADGVFTDPGRQPFASAFVAVIDTLTLSMRYASAGHLPALLRRPNGEVVEVGGAGLLVGVHIGDAARHVGARAIEPGSLIVLYTDGLTEATRDPMAGEQLLSRAIATLEVNRSTAAMSANTIRDVVLGPSGTSHDDVAVLAVFIEDALDRAGGENATSWQFDSGDADAAHRAQREITTILRQRGLGDADVFAAETIVAELVANAFRHARTRVEMALDATQNHAVLHVIDSGRGFSLNPKLPNEPYAECGRGLFIINATSREFVASPRTLTDGSHARAVLPGMLRRAR